MKLYKLLKDLPNEKAGAMFYSNAYGNFYNSDSVCYEKDTIENNPEWFEPVKEKVKKKVWIAIFDKTNSHFTNPIGFVYDDKLICEHCHSEKYITETEIEVEE